jgi:hypothetical protein
MYAYVACSISDDFDKPVGICGTKIKIQIQIPQSNSLAAESEGTMLLEATPVQDHPPSILICEKAHNCTMTKYSPSMASIAPTTSVFSMVGRQSE